MTSAKAYIINEDGTETRCERFYLLSVVDTPFGTVTIEHGQKINIRTIALSTMHLLCENLEMSPKKALKYLRALYDASENHTLSMHITPADEEEEEEDK